MKITSLFSRISHGPSKTITENNDDKSSSSNLTIVSSPISVVSSPDVIPSSPVVKKNRSVRAKRSLNSVLVDNGEHKDELTICQTDSVSLVPKKILDIIPKCAENSKGDNYEVDSQTFVGTESLGSTICDDTDFCSDLVFDDWVESSSPITK